MARLTIEQIMNLTPLQIRRTSDTALRQYTQTLADAMNKRVKRLMADEFGKQSEFIQTLKDTGKLNEGGPTFTLEGKNTRKTVKPVFDQLRVMYQSKGRTTIAGVKKMKRRAEKRLGRKFGTPEEYGNFWKAYRQLEANFGGQFPKGYGSDEVQKMVSSMKYSNKNWDEIVNDVEKELGDIYEKQEGVERENESDLFGTLSEAADIYDEGDDDLPY